jgi:uncharacterized protein (TIGR02246 family)
MRSAITAFFVVVLVVPTAAQGPAAGADEAAVRRVIQQHDDARNRGNWTALGELFTQDSEQLTSAGEWRRGRAQIEKAVAQATATIYKGGTYTTKIDTVRVLTPTVAIADGAFEISNIAGGSRRGHTTYVLVKSGDAWRIAATRSMVPTAAGATPGR